MSKIAFVTASPETVSSFLTGYIARLAEKHQVHVVTSVSDTNPIRGISENIIVHNIPISRAPNLSADLVSLWRLWRFFSVQKFDAIHSVTPKAGLLSQISGFFARVPLRFHTFTGQVWVTKTGLARWGLKQLDKVIAALSTFALVDSPSQREFLLTEKVVSQANSAVLADGSISGVSLTKYQFSADMRQQLRKQYQLSQDDFVCLFVGRLNKEKGIAELLSAFKQLDPELIKSTRAKLFVLGSDEDNIAPSFEQVDNLHYLGFKTNVSDYYSFADVLCLPSHREGFGNVVIEAAACGLPTIASNIYGLSDAVEDQVSGLLHTVKNPQAITACLTQLLTSKQLTAQLKANARKRVEDKFDEQRLITEFVEFYHRFGIEK